MDSTGIVPTMPVTGYGDGFGGSGGAFWIFALIVLLGMGGNGFFGGQQLGYRPSTAEDVNNGFNFSELQSENRDILSAISGGTAQTVAAVNQAKYDNINVAKDIEAMVLGQVGEVKVTQAQTLAHQQECLRKVVGTCTA